MTMKVPKLISLTAAQMGVISFLSWLGMLENMYVIGALVLTFLLFVSPVSPFVLFESSNGPDKDEEIFYTGKPHAPWVQGMKPAVFRIGPVWLEYLIAGKIGEAAYALGLKPNHITYFNLVFRSAFCYHLLVHPERLWLNIPWIIMQQIFDDVDGLMARRYKMGSEFGAWLDITCDNIFGTLLISVIIAVHIRNINFLMQAVVLGTLVVCGTEAWSKKSKKVSSSLDEVRCYTFNEILGAWMEEWMSCILMYAAFTCWNASYNNFWYDPSKPTWADNLMPVLGF